MSIREEWEARLSNLFPEETVTKMLQEAERMATETATTFAFAIEQLTHTIVAGLGAVGRLCDALQDSEEPRKKPASKINNRQSLKRMITGKRKPREWD